MGAGGSGGGEAWAIGCSPSRGRRALSEHRRRRRGSNARRGRFPAAIFSLPRLLPQPPPFPNMAASGQPCLFPSHQTPWKQSRCPVPMGKRFPAALFLGKQKEAEVSAAPSSGSRATQHGGSNGLVPRALASWTFHSPSLQKQSRGGGATIGGKRHTHIPLSAHSSRSLPFCR